VVNVFELVRDVLDEAYAEIPGTKAQKDTAIKKDLEALGSIYANVWKTGGPPFSDPVRRFAYVFRYVTCHANLVNGRIANSKPLVTLMQRPELVITALGGGPGSDAIGVAKYLQAAVLNPTVQFYLCDRESLWSETWGDLGMKLRSGLNINTTYLTQDVLEPRTWKPFTKCFKADLFTLIYFISEVYAHRDKAEPYFKHVLQSARPGAHFLYIDNNHDYFNTWFDDMAERGGLSVLSSYEGYINMPSDEQMDVLEKYIKKFGAAARLKANTAYRVLVKK